MMTWLPFFIAGLVLLVADAAGLINLSMRPFLRMVRWLSAATVAWFLPTLAQKLFHLQIDERHLNLWQLFILGVLAAALLLAAAKWIWKYYGPAPEGHRRCPHCRKPILKVMIECPACRKSIA